MESALYVLVTVMGAKESDRASLEPTNVCSITSGGEGRGTLCAPWAVEQPGRLGDSMRDFTDDIKELRRRVDEARAYLRIDDTRLRLTELEVVRV